MGASIVIVSFSGITNPLSFEIDLFLCSISWFKLFLLKLSSAGLLNVDANELVLEIANVGARSAAVEARSWCPYADEEPEKLVARDNAADARPAFVGQF